MELEMEMGIDYLSFYQHLNPPPSPSSGGQEAFSYYHHYTPYTAASAAMASNGMRDGDLSLPAPPPRQRQRAARTDRHSKIRTAAGMRDRRMRLSLDVARRFFALQDTLGFDKASKTVQWLLDMSTAGINHLLAADTTSMSISSEEDGSGSVLMDSSDHLMAADAETNNCKMPTKAGTRNSSNGGPVLLPNKESRLRARQRARERTVERNRVRPSVSTVAEEAPAAPAPAPARQVILPVIPPSSSSSSFGSYCEEQEPWELGGVVFAKPRHR